MCDLTIKVADIILKIWVPCVHRESNVYIWAFGENKGCMELFLSNQTSPRVTTVS